jgi:hypothetical protein
MSKENLINSLIMHFVQATSLKKNKIQGRMKQLILNAWWSRISESYWTLLGTVGSKYLPTTFLTSVVDPDPRVFRAPGSGSISQRYGSGSIYH